MPMVSQAQRAFLHIHHPDIAKEFEAKTPKDIKLPEHVVKKARAKALASKIGGFSATH